MTKLDAQVMGRLDLPGTILFGGGSRWRLPEVLADLGIRRPLLVTDRGVVELGFVGEMVTFLNDAGCEVAIYDGVQPDPTDENVEAGVAALIAHDADGVIALGGGSPIDTAKVIAVREANPGALSDYMGLHKIARRGLPLVVLPTTAGTGSEATKVAVITNTERRVKMMMLSLPLLPAVAVVDYEYSIGMPRGLTAAVGVDTLTHGIEAYVSRKANAMTDPLALSCVELVGKYLERAWRDGTDREAREGMMLAACQGGMAFANSSVCLVHGMSRPLGALFHLPHGLSNAILLPTVTRWSVEAARPRYATIARTLGFASAGEGEVRACEKLLEGLVALNQALELPRMSACKGVERGVFESELEKMATDALASGSPANNPRVPEVGEIVSLYREAW